MMSLREEFKDIDGVGDAIADELMAVVEAHESGGIDPSELERIASMLERGGKSAALSRLNDLLE